MANDLSKFAQARCTVNGARPSQLDPLVSRLVEGFEKYGENHEGLETEAKLGLVKLHKNAKNRLKLPLESEVILADKNTTDNKYMFAAGVEQFQYNKIKRLLDEMHQKPRATRFAISEVTRSQTVDDMFLVDGNRVRISYKAKALKDNYLMKVKPEVIVEKMVKVGLEDVNIWSGPADNSGPSNNSCSHRDIRISFRDEQKWDGEPPEYETRSVTRKKNRTTYHFNGWKADITKISEVDPKRGQEKTKFEVEFELRRDLVMQHYHFMKQGKDHSLYSILTDFIWFVRDFAWFFSDGKKVPDEIVDLASCKPNANEIEKYKKNVSTVLPILGHYLFKVSDEMEPLNDDNNNDNSNQNLMNEASKDSNINNLSLNLEHSNYQPVNDPLADTPRIGDPTPRIGSDSPIDKNQKVDHFHGMSLFDDDFDGPPAVQRSATNSPSAGLVSPRNTSKTRSPSNNNNLNQTTGLDPDLPVFEMDLDPPPFANNNNNDEDEFDDGELATPASQDLGGIDIPESENDMTPMVKRMRRN